MSVQNIPQQSIPHSKTIGVGPDYAQPVQHKALGNTQQSSGDLAAWYEHAYEYYQAVQNGSEPMPDQAAWQEFLNQMNWAYQQLWGGGAGGAWDPMVGGGSGPAVQGENEFGGMMGPNGEWVYTSKENNIGIGLGGSHHTFGSKVNIFSQSMSTEITLVEVIQGDPPEKIWKLVATDKAFPGKEEVFYIENIEELENLTIQAANPGAVTLNIEDPELLEKINVEEFNGVNLGDDSPNGMPQGSTIEDGTAIHEGLENDFYPPFGNISDHEVWGAANISVKGSDHVEIRRRFDGTHIVEVTSRDGEVTTFTIKPGNPVNINANPAQVTFRQGAGHIGNRGPGKSGSDGVPAGWEGFSLNGQGPIESENDLGDGENVELSDNVLHLLEYLGLDPSEVDIDEAFMSGLSSMPPSKAVIDWLIANDSVLADRLQAADLETNSAHKQKQVNERLAELLSYLYPEEMMSPNADQLIAGRFDEEAGEGLTDRQEAGLFTVGSSLFNIRINPGGNGVTFQELTEEELNEMAGVKSEEEKAAEEISEGEQTVADALAQMPSISADADRIIEIAREKDIDLGNVAFPPNRETWELLLSLDEHFISLVDGFRNEEKWGRLDERANNIRSHAVGLLNALYQEQGYYFSAGGTKKRRHNNDIVASINGMNTGYNLFSDDYIKNGWNGNNVDLFNMQRY